MSLTILFLQICVFFLVGAIVCRTLYKLYIYNIELIKRSHKVLDYVYQLEARLDLHETALMNEGIINISWEELLMQLNHIEKNASTTEISPERKNNVYYLNKTEDN